MRMRPSNAPATVLIAICLVCVSAMPPAALERTPVAAIELDHDKTWAAAATCTISYYNICTGWIWEWDPGSPDHVIGVVFDAPTPTDILIETRVLYGSIPYWRCAAGWGYVGTINITEADENDCPVWPALASQPFFPEEWEWGIQTWNIPVPQRFIVAFHIWCFQHAGNHFVTDHPAPGPTGPSACGTCYPLDRQTRSFYYGTTTAPVVPGEPFFDGTCNCEFLWSVGLQSAVKTDESSWARIKNYYR